MTRAGSVKAGVQADYGIDAPGIVAMFGLSTVLSTAGATLIGWLASPSPLIIFLVYMLSLAAVASGFLFIVMLVYARSGKFRMRDFMLDEIGFRGDERVLDIGSGAGLLLVGAAKRLTTGGAIGIDIWKASDLSNNLASTAERNIAIENVGGSAEILTADACDLPFADATFDVVLSLLCLHNIEPSERRVQACREIARTLKPGGRALIADYVPTAAYERALAASGLETEGSRRHFLVALGPMWMVAAREPG
ncbi:MAG: class I SAM-dependent methyltransferase [Beijerinckiaceae bacterium]|nr:class I SAM-dependent methyltransferase [Beijerinckiaceae bacterium]